MGSEQPDNSVKVEFNDSGCIQDEPAEPSKAAMDNGYTGRAQLLDLSDDVLLYILRYCSPHDLKALGFTCARLGSLILEKSLWSRVDARDVSMGRARTRWILNNALHEGTKAFMIKGMAEQSKGCRGHLNRTRKQAEDEEEILRRHQDACSDAAERGGDDANGGWIEPSAPFPPFLHLTQMPRMSASPCWPESDSESELGPAADGPCSGPVFTVGRGMMARLKATCPHLAELHLDYCNINCNKTNLSVFPATLKKLSLRGTRCYNLPLDISFLFKIHDYLPVLEYLDLSECEWLEPANFLPLSKMTSLRTLLMRDCMSLSEFVAYVSLASRYGFSQLQVLDVCGSPLGDSEVSAFGWLPELRELYLSAPTLPLTGSRETAGSARHKPHYHYLGQCGDRRPELDHWETQIPDYYNVTAEGQEEEFDHNVEETTSKNDGNSNLSENIAESQHSAPKRKAGNCSDDNAEAGPSNSKMPKTDTANAETDFHKALANIQNSRISVTKNNGFVTFKRTVNNNNVQNETNQQQNASSDSKKDDASKDKKENDQNRTKQYSSRVVLNLDAAGPSDFSVRCRVNEALFNDASDASSSSKSDSQDEDPFCKRRKFETDDGSDDEIEKDGDNNNTNGNGDGKSKDRNASDGASGSSNEPKRPRYFRFSRTDRPQPMSAPTQEQAHPRHQILYVNLGRQIHAVFSEPSFSYNNHHLLSVRRVEYSTLVSDNAIRRFGRADGEDINIVNIGPNGPHFVSGRPNRSNLRILSATGYRNITNRSLVHLATAAPLLERIDFSSTGVTAEGVEQFKSLKPDCEVIFSEFKEEPAE